ncbi:MBG domain-containing protein [Polynucleobacter paneuropaeus]|uniref:MBG domain-containing protein n=1 Tax=Polynucleobacter paneuropaeus TaxID=2527775 RepID=UPI000DBF0EDC|nr:MBG domain-containing protein [Polynucleobacter paneuropaeus]AWW44097.1 hypothetical protein DPM16_01945 [Polynucleobacter paneuropaeus]
MERSLLSSNHPEKQFDVKLPMAGKVFALVCLFALSTQFALAQNKIAVNALPTGGNVVAGAATISSTSTAKSATMNINQTSQRAVINWQTFNVGKNATVNFNQPNSGSVTLNRVVSATPSMIQGAINANGQVILVNPNGVTFGKGAQVNAAGVVASTLNISNQDFMNGKNIYSGNGEGKIVNKGTITATDPNGYIALLAPEIRNQGYLIARMGPSSTVALASGEKISLDFRGTQLIGVSIDKAAYKALIENKRIIETNGGVIIVAAGTARELMSSVIQNTGRISANSIVDNGGVIELVADNVTNSGSISANGGTNGVGGQVNIVGNNITLAANSQTTATGNLGGGSIQVGVGKTVATNTTPASAVNGNANTAAAPQTAAQILASNTQGVGTQAQTVSVEQGAVVDASAINSGNGGAIVIWSQVKTTVNGILKAVGGYLNGNGGLIETSSAGLVSLGKSLSIDTSSSKGSAGLWYVDPIDLTIDGASSAVISAALVNNNVSITVAGNTCPSLGSCTQNGSGNLTIASGADIIKQSGSLTTLTLTASGVFNLNANISGQNLDVIINSSIAYLNAGSTITANQVTVQAQTIYSYGNINSGSLSNLGSAIQLLGSALYISGNLTVGANLANSSNSTSSNSNTVSYNGTLIRQEDLPTYLAAANQTTLNLDQVYATTAANQANFTTAVNNQITLTGTESISIAATAQLLANGTTGGVIMATAPQINLVTTSNSSPSSGSQSIQGNGSLIQANGNNGPGGTISFTAANDFNINVATISASGSTDGGSIRLISSGGNLLMANSLIQTNGGTGRGGSLGVSGANSTTINSSTLEATGFSKGGSIMVGYDSAGKSIPFSQSTTIDAASILSANQTDSTNTTGGGLIETSGGTLTQLASINAGRGGMWLLDPYDYFIGPTEASNITAVLASGSSVTISTANPTSTPDLSSNFGIPVVTGVHLVNGGNITINANIIQPPQNGGGYPTLTFDAGTQTIYLGANSSITQLNISVRGGVNFNSPVVIQATNASISSLANIISFSSTVNGNGLTPSTLTINSGGYVIFQGNVGTIAPLANLSVIAPGQIRIYGDITVIGSPLNGSTASIMLSGPVNLYGSSNINGGTGNVYILDAVTSDSSVVGYSSILSVVSNINGTNGEVGFGSTVNLSGSLMTTAATTYLAGNVTTAGQQIYSSNVNIIGSAVQLNTGNNSDLTIGGVLSGSYYANTPVFLYANGYYSLSNNPIAQGNSVNLAGGVLKYNGTSSGQSNYTWTPTYDAVGSILAVGGGSGSNTTGMGGNGGSVVINRMVEFGAASPVNLSVGLGGVNGGSGGNTVVTVGGSNWITATGGQCCQSAGNGGANPAPPDTNYVYVYGNGLQAFGFLGMNNGTGSVPGFVTGGPPGGPNTVNGSTGTWFGNGGFPGTGLGAQSVAAAAAGIDNTGGGGGRGANGGNGVLMFNEVTNRFVGLSINVGGGKVTIGVPAYGANGINGYAHGTIDGNSGNNRGSSLNSLAITAGSSASVINGPITDGVGLTFSGTQLNGIYGSLTLNGNNTYNGDITISSGTLVAGSGQALGVGTYIKTGLGTLDLNGFTFTNAGLNLWLMGTGVNSNGALINSNINSLASFAGQLNVGIDSYIGGPGSILIKGRILGPAGLAFVNGASVSATNPTNLALRIAGFNAGTIYLSTGDVFVVGTVGALSGFTGTSSGSINLYSTGWGIQITQSIIAQSIYIYGNGTYQNNIGVEIESATLHATTGGITIYGVSTYTGAGIMIGGPSVLVTDSSSGNISLYGYAPRLGIVFGGFGGSGGRSPIGATQNSPLTLSSAGNIVLAGYADMASGPSNIFGISLNSALPGSTPQYALLKAAGDIILAGSTPNCACFSAGDFGAAISVQNTPINAIGQVIFEGANLTTISYAMTGGINSSQGGLNGSAANFNVANPVPSSAQAPSFADGYQQAYGVYISNSAPVTYGGISYSNTVAGGAITINASSYSGLGFSSDSNLSSSTGALTIATNGDGNAATGGINLTGAITKNGAEAANINISSTSDVYLGNITDTASAPIHITGGYGIAAGNTAGGTITHLGTITSNSPIALSMASAPTGTCTVASCPIAGALGITSANASTLTNIAYSTVGGAFVTPQNNLGGTFINYRQSLASNTYSVFFNSNYSATYGTAYNSSSANAWLQTNATVSAASLPFGLTASSIAAGLRFNNSIDGLTSANNVQSGTTIVSSSLSSIDGASVIVTGGITRTYTISPASLMVTANNQAMIYGASVPSLTYTYSGLVNGDSSASFTGNLVTTASSNSNIGTYGITQGSLAATGNYIIGSYNSASVAVAPAPLIVSAVAKTMVYGSSVPSLTYTYTGLVLSQSSTNFTGSLSTTATSSATVGGYIIGQGTLTATGNYVIASYVAAIVTITPATLTITANADSKVYGATSTTAGLNYSAGVAVSATGYSATGLVNGDTITNVNFSSTGGSNTANVGTYTITPTSETGSTRTNSSNYNIVFNPGTMTVTPAPLSVVANAQTMAYGAAVPTLTYTYTGLVNNQSSTTFTGALSTTALSTSSVGTYAISQGNLAATGNYAITSYTPGYVTITPAALTITANNQNTTYGTSLNLGTSAFTVSGLVNGNSIANVNLVQGSNSIVPGSQAAGIYSGSNGIVASSATAGSNTTLSNYSITYMPGTLTITPATLTITANNQSTTYGSPLVLGSSAFTSSGLVNNDLINSVTLMQGGNSTVPVTQNAGTYSNTNGIIGSSASGAGLSNYSIVYVPGTLTINKAVLTVNPNAQSQVYNGATLNTTTYSDNVANYTITGYKNSDTSTNAPITLTGSMAFNPVVTANTTVTNVDTYHFGGGTLAGISSNSNYSVAFANASNNAYTITKAQLILSGSKVYDGNNTLTNSVVIGGLVGNQILNYSGATANSANVNAPGVSGATYISAITIADGANGGLASNYQLPTLANQNTSNTFSITPKTVTLSASKTYDSTTTLFAGQVTINTGITGEALTYSAGRINNANVSANGSNFITALTLNSLTGTASNYALPTLNSTNAPVTVNPATLTVTGSVSPDKTYDGTTVTTVSKGQLQGLINNQTLTLSQAGAFASANAGTAINVVVNDSIANGTGTNAGIASNYSLTQPTDVVANITPKNLTVTGSATSNKVYDGTFTATITGGQLVGVVAADIANVVLTQTGTFTAANVGNTIAITANDSLTGSLAGNYSLTQPTVAAANITPKMVSLSATKTYDSTTSLLGAVTILTGVGTETLGYTVAKASDANVVTTGKYITEITLVNGSGLTSNYVLPVLNVANAPVTINPVTALKVVGATAQGKTYDGTTSVTLSNTGTLQGLIGSQTLTLTEAGAFATANADSAVNVVMNDSISNGTNGGLASNYSLTQPTYVTAPIAKAPLGITVTGTYTASTTIAPSAFTVNGLVNKESITTLSTATLHDANVTTANNYVQSIAIAAGTANMNNYAITQNYNNLVSTTQNMAVITPKSLTVTGTQVTPKSYDATDSANLSGGNLVGVIAGDLANIHLVETGHFVSQNIGAAVGVIAADTITGSASSNYTLVQPTGLSAQISAINLVITISPETKVYGNNYAKTSNSTDGTNISTDTVNYVGNIANNSAKGFSVSGIVGTEDGVSGVTLTSLGGSVTANAASGNAAYAITGSAATGTGLGNYNIQYVSNNYSVLTVTPAPLTITLAGGNNNPAISYGSSVLPTLTPVIAGIVNNDQVSVTLTTSATPYVNGVAGSASSVGSYPITVSGLNNGNYSLPANTQVGTVVVNPAPLNIQANTQGANGSIVYGTPTVLASDSSAFTATGLVNGDKVNTATINYIALGQTIGSNTVSGSTAAGTYNGTLVVSPGSATGSGLLSNTGVSNYTISYSTGNLIITPAPLTVTAVNDAKLVGQSDTPGYAGVIFSGFKNADTPTGLNLTGLKITRINTGVNNDSAGYSSGVLVPTLNSSSLSGNLNSNYTYNYINGDYSILPAGALLVKLPSNTINYGAGITYGTPTASYIPVGSSSPVTLSALVDPNNANNIIVSSVNQQIPATNVALTIGGAAYSGSNNLNVGSYNLLNSTSNSAVGALNPAEPGAGNFTNIVTIGGLSVLPQVVHLSSLNISGVTKSYDGLTSMSTLSVTGGQFVTRDNISLSASGSFADKNVGINNKSYTVGLTLSGSDAKNYVVDGGAVYSGTNGTINPIDYVYYVGSAAGGAWSDPASWKATTAANIIPAASVLTGPVPDGANVKNVIIPVGSSVIYDASVLTPVDASVSLANAGNVSFGSGNSTSNTNLSINMGISGAGTVTITGIGSVTLAGANTYTGNTIISSGSTLYANAGNSIGAGNIQGQGGSFGVAPNASNVIFTQINATGSLRLISDITTSGNQTYGNLLIGQPTVSGSQLTTLTSQNGNITINGTLDSTLPATSISLSNSLLLKTQNGSVTLNSSVGTITPLNIIEVDAKSTNINADVLTNSQQEYCGPSGCFAALTTAQQNANYCSSNDCFSVLTPSLLGSSSAATYCSTNSCFTSNGILSYTLASAGTGDYANTANGVVVIGDNGQPGFLYNQYTSYVSSVNMTPLGIFQNNPVYARTLMSRDPLVKIGGYQMDASATAIHTLQTAAIQLAGDQVTPTVQIDNGSVPKTNNGQIVRDANGNIVPANPLYSQGSLSASVGSTTTLAGSFDIAPGTTTTTAESQSYGARSLPSIVNSTSSNKVSLNVQDPYASINISVPPGITVNSLNLSASTNSFGVNGHSPTGVTGFVQHTALNGAIPTSPVVSTAGRVAAPTPSTPTTRNSFILAAVAEQTKIERKYDVDASVDVGEIETDDGPAAADDQDDKKKKKAGNQKAAQ